MKAETLFPIAIMLIVFLVVAATFAGKAKRLRQDDSYEVKDVLLTKYERRLYRVLIEALPEMAVLPQVSMNQLFQRCSSQAAQNKISQNSVDFLLCDQDFKIFAAVELNGRSHQSATQQRRDNNKANALQSAGIPLLVYENHALPSVQQIRNDVILALQT